MHVKCAQRLQKKSERRGIGAADHAYPMLPAFAHSALKLAQNLRLSYALLVLSSSVTVSHKSAAVNFSKTVCNIDFMPAQLDMQQLDMQQLDVQQHCILAALSQAERR